MTLCDKASELHNVHLEIYFDEYKALLDAQERKLSNKFNLFLERCNYDVWFENEELTDKEEYTFPAGKDVKTVARKSCYNEKI